MSRFLCLLAICAAARAEEVSAFRFADDPKVKRSIDIADILRGVGGTGDPRDGIPAIRKVEAVPAAKAAGLRDEDRVLGLRIGEEARAYPLRFLELHEMVNDVLGGIPVAPNY